MTRTARALTVGATLLALSVALGGCGSTKPEASTCPVLKGVDLSSAHLSAADFTPARAANGSLLTDATGHVYGCSALHGPSTGLTFSVQTQTDPQRLAADKAQHATFKAQGTALNWPGLDAVVLPRTPESLEIHVEDGDRFVSVVALGEHPLPMADAEALVRALLK